MNITVRMITAQANSQMRALMASTGGVGTSMGAASLSASRFGFALDRLNLVRRGSQMQWLGRQIQSAFTLPLVAATGFAVKWALENEKAFTRVTKLYTDASVPPQVLKAELVQLRQTVVDLSNAFGVAQADVSSIMGDWAAAGSTGIALAKSTELTLRTMALGEIDAKKATQGLIAIQAQWGLSTEELTKTMEQLNIAENISGASLNDLIEGFSRASSVARLAGLSTAQLAGYIAALKPAAGGAAKAGNSIKSVQASMMAPTRQVTAVLDQMKIKTDETAFTTLNFAERLDLLRSKYGTISNSQKAVVAETIAGKHQFNAFAVIMEDTANTGGYYNKVLKGTSNATYNHIQSQKELDEILKSSPKRLEMLVNVFKNMAADLGQKLIPVVLSLMAAFGKLMNWFNNLNPATQKFLLQLGLFLVVLGPIVKYLGILMQVFGMLINVIKWTGGAFMWLRTQMIAAIGSQVVVTAYIRTATAIQAVAIATQGRLVAIWIAGSSAVTGVATAAQARLIAVMATGSKIIQAIAFSSQVGLLMIWQAGSAPVVGLAKALWAQLYTVYMLGKIGLRGILISLIVDLNFVFGAAWAAGLANIRAASVSFWASMRSLWLIQSAAILVTGQTLWIKAQAIWVAGSSAVWTATSSIWVAGSGLLSAISIATQKRLVAIQLFGSNALTSLIAITQTKIAALHLAGSGRIAAIKSALILALISMETKGIFATVSVEVAGWVARQRVAIAGSQAVVAVQGAFFRAMLASQLAWSLVVVPMWGSLWSAIVSVTVGGMTAVVAAVTSPAWFIPVAIAAALAAVIAIIVLWGDDIVGFFGDIVGWIIKQWNALPQAIVDVFNAVIRIINEAAMAVQRAFASMNPFARHSPSMVDNVTHGMNEVGRQFGLVVPVIEGHIAQAKRAMDSFGNSARSVFDKADANEFSKQRKVVKKVSPESLSSFDSLVQTLRVLKHDLDSVSVAVSRQEGIVNAWKIRVDASNDALKKQEDILSRLKDVVTLYSDRIDLAKIALQSFVDAPIAGERAMGNAIFNNEIAQKRLRLEMMKLDDTVQPLLDNEMAQKRLRLEILKQDDTVGVIRANETAQKRLRLEIMKIEEATGPLESLEEKFNLLNGAIELASGKREELRQAGAGSEILNEYDKEIAALQKQKSSIELIAAPLKNLHTQLDQLGKNAEKLELERSLKLDPLRQKLEDLEKAAEKMNLSKAIKLDPLQRQLDNLGLAAERLDLEKSLKFDVLHKQIDQLANGMRELPFNTIIAGVITNKAKLAELQIAYDIATGAVKRQEVVTNGLKAARDKVQSSYEAESKKLDLLKGQYDQIKTAIDGVKGSFSDVAQAAQSVFDIQKGLTGAAKEFANASGGNFATVAGKAAIARDQSIKDQEAAIKEMNKKLQKDLQKTLDDLDLELEMPWANWSWSGLGSWLYDFFLKAWVDAAGKIFMTSLVWTMEVLINLPESWDKFKIWWSENINQPVIRAWNELNKWFVENVDNPIIDFFERTAEAVVGHSIVPDMITDIVKYFAGMPWRILAAIVPFSGDKNTKGSFAKWANDSWNKAKFTMEEKWTELKIWFSGRPTAIIIELNSLPGKMKIWAMTSWETAKQAMITKWNELNGWLSGRPQAVINSLWSLYAKMSTWALGVWTTAKQKMLEGWNGLLTWLNTLPGKAAAALAGMGTAVANSVKNAWNGAANFLNKSVIGKVNSVVGTFGIKIPNMPTFQQGGVIPGSPSRRDNTIVAARTGEGVIIPETVRKLGGSSGVKALNDWGRGSKLQGFEDGGIIGDTLGKIGGAIGGAVGKAKSVAGAVGGWFKKNIIDRVEEFIKNGSGYALYHLINPASRAVKEVMPTGFTETFTSSVVKKWGDAAKVWGEKKDAESAVAGTGGGNASTGRFSTHGRWPENTRGHRPPWYPHVQSAANFIKKTWPNVKPGSYVNSGTSDHFPKAIDAMTSAFNPAGLKAGNELSAYFINNPNAFGTKYVIWNKRFTEGRGWGPYTGTSNPHTDHVHLSFMSGAGTGGSTPLARASGPGDPGGRNRSVPQQAYNAARGSSAKVLLALFEAGLVESGMRNLGHQGSRNDHDSLGYLQQRPSMGWPNPMNIATATRSFTSRASKKQNAYKTAGRLAQAVQGSAYPAKYDKRRADAIRLLRSINPAYRAGNYDKGGPLEPGYTSVYNGTGKTEMVSTARDMLTLARGMSTGALAAGTYGDTALLLARMEDRIIRSEGKFTPSNSAGNVINIYGDLILPNIKSGSDAETFVRNLEALAR